MCSVLLSDFFSLSTVPRRASDNLSALGHSACMDGRVGALNAQHKARVIEVYTPLGLDSSLLPRKIFVLIRTRPVPAQYFPGSKNQ